ncbi:MAG: family 1 glycosylhydrolase [Aquihabitans sp.]
MPSDLVLRWGSRCPVLSGPGPASDVAAARTAVTGEPAGALDLAKDLDAIEARAALGHDDVRLTFDWARLEPVPGQRDGAAVEHLREVLGACRRLGIEAWGCLHEAALPGWFAVDEHGLADDRARRYYWARHVEQVGEAVGDLVDGWIPMLEPSRWALRGWLTGAAPPGHRDDAEGFSGALEGALLGSIEAAQRLRGSGRPVATGQWVVPAFPGRVTPDVPPSPDAEAMTTTTDEVLFGCWRRLVLEETLVVPGRNPIEVPGARRAFDRIGFTYRHAVAVRGDGALLPYPQQLPTGADGQVAWAEGLALAVHHVAETFPEHPLLLAGHGVPADDPAFDEFEHESRAILRSALEDGIDLRAAWWAPPLDPSRPPQRP